MNWYLECFRKYADFSGRARRTEYWMFVLFNIIVSLVLAAVDNLLGLKVSDAGILSTIYSLLVLVPSIAVSIRRLHDTGRTGWLLLLAFIPCIGAIILIVFYAQDSQPGENQYGPNPKQSW